MRSHAAAQREVNRADAEAQDQLRTLRSLSHEVTALLAQCGYRDPEPEALRLRVYRFPLLGDLFGYRTVVKAGWKIAAWKYDREKPGHTISLLADGKYCWNGRIVNDSEFADWHGNFHVGQGVPLMIDGLDRLRETLVARQSE